MQTCVLKNTTINLNAACIDQTMSNDDVTKALQECCERKRTFYICHAWLNVIVFESDFGAKSVQTWPDMRARQLPEIAFRIPVFFGIRVALHCIALHGVSVNNNIY